MGPFLPVDIMTSILCERPPADTQSDSCKLHWCHHLESMPQF